MTLCSKTTICMLSLILASSLGCSHQMGISNKGFVWQAHLANMRVGYKLVTAGDAQVEQGSEAISPRAAEMLEEIIPALVEAAVKAALASAGISAAGSLLDQCDISTIFDGVSDDEPVVDEETVESEPSKKPGPRRTPEEKEANRAERNR